VIVAARVLKIMPPFIDDPQLGLSVTFRGLRNLAFRANNTLNEQSEHATARRRHSLWLWADEPHTDMLARRAEMLAHATVVKPGVYRNMVVPYNARRCAQRSSRSPGTRYE
jgi:hypothetical protein